MAVWKEISVNDWSDNLFTRIGKDWMLVTAGDREKSNTMTASWGGAGIFGISRSRFRSFARSAIRWSLWSVRSTTASPSSARAIATR